MDRPAKSAKKADLNAYIDHLEGSDAGQADAKVAILEARLSAAHGQVKQLKRNILRREG